MSRLIGYSIRHCVSVPFMLKSVAAKLGLGVILHLLLKLGSVVMY